MAERERRLSYVVYQEDDGFVARCLDVNVASEGDTEPEAIDNLREALELYFEDADELDLPPVTHAHVDSLTLKSA
jgi:predicted RNase H-like HicB family nuclease